MNVFIIFSIFFGGFAVMMSFADFTSEEGTPMPEWARPALVGVLGSLAMAFLFIWFMHRITSHSLAFDGHTLTYTRQNAFSSHFKSFSAPTIESWSLESFYEVNYRPVHGFILRDSHRKVRFGSSLPKEAKEWLFRIVTASLLTSGNNTFVHFIADGFEKE